MTRIDAHIHSRFSDGLNAPREIVELAVSRRFDSICIADHVSRDTEWLDDFLKEIEMLKNEFEGKIEILAGLEVEVLDMKGKLDVDPIRVSSADLVLASFHMIPSQDGYMGKDSIGRDKATAIENWFYSMKAVLKGKQADIIAHPGFILKSNGIEVPIYVKEELATLARRSGMMFEHNRKYEVPDEEFLSLLRAEGVKILPGSDAHNLVELDEMWRSWPDI